MSYRNNPIRIIFIGTPDFGVPALINLIEDKQFEIVAVITQPDKPIGRKQIIIPSPVKKTAQKYNIDILQPENIAEIYNKIKLLKPDLIVVIAYAQLIPQEILNIPSYGAINIHGSLLPKYRGASVIQAPILNSDQYTGITIMKMNAKLDQGLIIAQKKLKISKDETADTLYDKLSELGAKILIPTLIKYIHGEIKLKEQKHSKASFHKQLTKQDGKINWTNPAQKIERFVRAMTSWPCAWTNWNEKRLKITKVQIQPLEINSYKPGKTFIYNRGLAVQCGKDALIIQKLQLEGKKEMLTRDFLRGHNDFVGTILK